MNFKIGLVPLLLLCPTSVGFLEARVSEKEAPPLTQPSNSPIPPHAPDSSIIREQPVLVNLPLVRDPNTNRLQLPLFGGPGLLLIRDNRKLSPEGSVIWSGHVDGQRASVVTLVAGREVLIGNIATQPTSKKRADAYEIRYLKNPVHVLRQIDPSKLPPESDPRQFQVASSAALSSTGSPILTCTSPIPPCTSDPPDRVDALVLYTPKAREAAGGVEAIEKIIMSAEEETNKSYTDSGVKQQLRVVRKQEFAYVEQGGPGYDLQSLIQGIDAVCQIRSDVGADIVGLIVEYTEEETDSCGASTMMETIMDVPSTISAQLAYSIVPSRCASAPLKWSLAHEFGHLMGARHGWSSDKGDKPFRFSHAHRHEGGASGDPGFRTLMAKCIKGQECDRALYWSNPDKTYPASGVPLGSRDEKEPANNAETLNDTAPIVANFRCSKN